jgi:hypothetical protein
MTQQRSGSPQDTDIDSQRMCIRQIKTMRNEQEAGRVQRMDKSVVWRFSPRPMPNGTRGFLTLSTLAILMATL